MCKFGLVLLFTFLTRDNFAQDYFVLLQSDNRQPFYVRLGSQLYSSSPEGHLILAPLKDGIYTLEIGFPSRPGEERSYSFSTAQKDHAFLIKEHGEAGWGLYDPAAKDWLTAKSPPTAREELRAIGARREDAFSRLMASVVLDTAVLYNDYANPNLAKTDSVASTTPTAETSRTGMVKPSDGGGSMPAADSALGAASTSKPAVDSSLAAAMKKAKVDSPAIDNPSTALTPLAGGGSPAIPVKPKPAVDSVGSSVTHKAAVDSFAPPMRTKASTDSFVVWEKPKSPVDSFSTTVGSKPVGDTPAAAVVAMRKPDSPLYRQPTGIVKLSEKKLSRTRQLVYADKSGGANSDTVVVIIPLDSTHPAARPVRSDPARSALAKSDFPHSSAGGSRATGSDSLSRQNSSVPLIVPTPVNPSRDPARSGDSGQKRSSRAPIPYINSDCHAFATDYDVDKLRVKMLIAEKEDERIAAAQKAFRIKCFSTRQIRALSEVFAGDAGKFHFFEAAYPFAADAHFRELLALLADPVYVGKFKAMTGMR